MGMININKPIKKYSFVSLCIIVVGLFLYQEFDASYKFEYLYSIEKKNVVTRIEYESLFEEATYFTTGYYCENEIPNSYVKPIYSGFTSGFQLVFFWKNDTCVFNHCYGIFEVVNPEGRFLFKKVMVDELMDMKNDTTGDYHYEIEKALF
ncbi:hypothetical protein [Vallitalea sp.]|jgi:hypothetical protein|uniref:hypothetical protein n=1 Tax=Vallitalea sp. TaxID=1882829 RepID=UPI0025EAEF0B|nr:hypothetical protein [Vallitalea sp.]MCT4686872.1 hypothetical protein [Vallitalea sp.]